MRKALLATSAALVVLAGCGGSSASVQLPKGLDQGLYVICTGKPRFCAVADARDPNPEWVSADELSPGVARRFHRLVGTGSVPLAP